MIESSKIASTIVSAVKNVHKEYRYKRLDKKLDEIQNEKNIKILDLITSDERFALFCRLQRACEICTSNEMINVLAEFLISGIKHPTIDEKQDIYQISFDQLAKLTHSEVNLLSELHKHNIYCNSPEDIENLYIKIENLRNELIKNRSYSWDELEILINSLSRNGFLEIKQGHFSDSESYYHLTELARYTITLILLREDIF
ncbi:hypothetical protein [Sessilibacter sp. MAH4]